MNRHTTEWRTLDAKQLAECDALRAKQLAKCDALFPALNTKQASESAS